MSLSRALAAALCWCLLLLAPLSPKAEDEAGPDQPAEEEPGKQTADEEIEDLVGPTLHETTVVTASRTEESILDAPVSITVVGQQQIETSAADNMADLLRGVPGVNAMQTSARQLSITTRTPSSALANSQLALVDGRSIYQDFFGLVMWDAVPVDLGELKQVEVVRGPGSAVWGANALSGVVNVRTKSPRELEGGFLSVLGGEQGTRQAAFRWADAFRRYSYKVSASWYEQRPWERKNTFNDGTPIPEEAEFDNGGTEQPKLDLRLDHEREDRLSSLRLGQAGTTGIMHTGIGPFLISRGSFMRYGEWDFEQGRLSAKLYLNQLDGDADNLLSRLPFAFETNTWVGELHHSRTFGRRHDLRHGLNLRNNHFDLSLAPGEDQRTEAGLFVEDRFQMAGRWTLNLGLRADWNDTIGWTLSPRTGLVYQPDPEQSIRLAWNRAFRSPSLINNFLDTAVPNRTTLDNGNPFAFVTFAQGDEDLTVESVDAVEVGWNRVVGDSLFGLAVYRNVTRDLIDFAAAEYYSAEDPPSGLSPDQVPERELVKTFRYRNVGEVVDLGLEVSLETWWRKGLHGTASYSFQNPSRITKDDPEEPLVNNLAARHQLSFTLSWQGPRHASSFGVSWTDEAFWADVLDERFWGWTDAYWLVNASFGTKFRGETLELRLAGTNLLDDPIKQHVFGDIIRRKLSAELRWRF